MPVRLIAGEHDRVVDHEFLRRAAADSSGVSFEVCEGDHRLPLTAPQRCIDAFGRDQFDIPN